MRTSPEAIMYTYGRMCMSLAAKYHRDKITYEQYSRYMQMIVVAGTNEMHRATEAMQQRSFSRGYEAAEKSMGGAAMKEHPILFSTPMVQAILEGRKTMTRRIVKPQPNAIAPFEYGMPTEAYYGDWPHSGYAKELKCPYGQPGDHLWVRETFQHTKILNINPEDKNYGYVYKADGQPWEDYEGWTWKPSIFMPREASRIDLLIKSIRVERLQDISDKDAINEGIEVIHESDYTVYKNYLLKVKLGSVNPIKSFRTLWQSINGPGSWEANPWVWVIEFERVLPRKSIYYH